MTRRWKGQKDEDDKNTERTGGWRLHKDVYDGGRRGRKDRDNTKTERTEGLR